MSLSSIVKRCASEVPRTVAIAVVDLKSGLPLTLKVAENCSHEALEMLGLSTGQIFKVPRIRDLDQRLAEAYGDKDREEEIEEVLISTHGFWHYFGRLKSEHDTAIVVVVDLRVNPGMLLRQCREIADHETVQ